MGEEEKEKMYIYIFYPLAYTRITTITIQMRESRCKMQGLRARDQKKFFKEVCINQWVPLLERLVVV